MNPKPCPKCGGAARVHRNDANSVRCSDFKCRLFHIWFEMDDWNRRASISAETGKALRDEVEARNIRNHYHFWDHTYMFSYCERCLGKGQSMSTVEHAPSCAIGEMLAAYDQEKEGV